MFGKNKKREETPVVVEKHAVPKHDSNWMHGYYWLLPLCASISWWGMYLGLLLWWAVADNAERYEISDATIEYVSNIGAEHQWLFILGSALTGVFYTLTLLAERWLRHLRRIPGALRRRDKYLDIAACIFGILGSCALIILASANDRIYPTVHWSFTAVFVVCIAISALCQTIEIWFLEQDHVERKHLRRNAIIKWIIVGTAVAAAIAFVGTYATCAGQPDDQPLSGRCDRIKSTAAVLEWLIAALYGVYLMTFGLDLWPARKTRGRKFEERLMIEDKNNTLHFHKDRTLPGAPGGILAGNNADLETGLTSTRPSESSAGQYGSQANLVAESHGVTKPEMAHAPTGHESFTPAPQQAAYASAPTNAGYTNSVAATDGIDANTQYEGAQNAADQPPHTIVYHNPHASPLSQSMVRHEDVHRDAY